MVGDAYPTEIALLQLVQDLILAVILLHLSKYASHP